MDWHKWDSLLIKTQPQVANGPNKHMEKLLIETEGSDLPAQRQKKSPSQAELKWVSPIEERAGKSGMAQ